MVEVIFNAFLRKSEDFRKTWFDMTTRDNQYKSIGYGILTDESISNNGTTATISSGNPSSTGLLTGDQRGFYGSINSRSSAADSYNRWYTEDYDTGISSSVYDEQRTDYSTQQSSGNQSYQYDTEDAISGAYSCEDSCCTDKEGAVVLSGDALTQMGETSGGEQTYYSPFYERKTMGVASNVLVGWNISNLLLSTSLLAFPFAVTTGGFVVLPLIVLICLMTIYTSRILISMMYEQSNVYEGRRIRVRVDYADLGQDAFNSYRGSWFIQTIQVLEMLSICVLNICVLGRLCHEILPKVDIKTCTVIVAFLALPTFFIRKLAVIGWMQTVGVFSLAIGLILIQGNAIANIHTWKFSAIPVYSLEDLPISIGIIIYAFGIQGVMPGLEDQMRKPKKFGSVVMVTFIISSIIQIVFSVTNAAYYQTRTNQVITIDLEDHLPLGIATACFIGISILSHFSLPTFVVLEKLDTTVRNLFPCCSANTGEDGRFNTFLSVLLRIIIVTISVGISVLLPYFAYLMAFVGCVITVLSALIVPCFFHLKLRYRYLPWYCVCLDVFIICFGLVCFCFGSYFSICTIYDDYMGF